MAANNNMIIINKEAHQHKDEYGVEHERNRATSLNRGNDPVIIDVPVLDDKIVTPTIERVDGARIVTVIATSKSQRATQTISYEEVKVLGEGSFGRVVQCLMLHNNNEDHSVVAIKSVLQDKRYRNRELSFIRQLDHSNVIGLKYYFFTKVDHERVATDGNAYLNLVMEYLPETLFAFIQRHNKRGVYVPIFYIKVAMHQIMRGMAYLHSQSFCHRDVKPHNILINEQTGVVKICDLGSMKQLDDSTANVSYICSRYFRAPELLMGCQHYSCAIDIWAVGCVMAEMFLRHPIFPGHNTQDQLARIVHMLGSPSIEKLKAISVECHRPEVLMQRFPVVVPKRFDDILPEYATADAIDLISNLLEYVPRQRITLANALEHPFFNDLRNAKATLPNGAVLPPLFNFTAHEQHYLHQDDNCINGGSEMEIQAHS